jgi:diguanylate cyclase (GGDEF)-like protein/hemerythrin-like metal-binding protein
MGMDNRTLAIALSIGAVAVAFLIVIMALYRKKRGLSVYAAGTTCAMLGFLLFLGQGTFNPWISYVLSNFLMVVFHMSLAWGLRLCGGLSVSWPRRFWSYLAMWALAFIPATFVWDSYPLRCYLMSLTIIVLSVEFLVALKHCSSDIPAPVRRAAWGIALSFCAAHVVRMVLIILLSSPRTKLLDDNVVTTFTLSITLFFCVQWVGLILILDAATLVVELGKKNALLSSLATTDPLTGLYNRRSLDSDIVAEMERARRYGHPLSIILFDLDLFKQVNDAWGHAIGDEVLLRVAGIARALVREPDGVYRWGGEEFLVLTPHTQLSGAGNLAEKLRVTLGAEIHPQAGTITASFGVAEWQRDEDREDLFRRVDLALYEAKHGGRNRVVVSTSVEAAAAARVRLVWRGEWESGNRLIDEEHRLLLDLANELLDLTLSRSEKAQVKALVERLFDHIDTHFADEERVLAELGYPDLAAHRQIHMNLAAEAAAMRDRFRADAADAITFFSFMVDKVIVGHLLAEDIRFFPYTEN